MKKAFLSILLTILPTAFYVSAQQTNTQAKKDSLMQTFELIETDQLMLEIQTLEKQGRYREAYDLFEVVGQRKSSDRKTELSKQIDELRAQYEVDRHIAEKESNRHRLFLAIVACVLLLLALLIYILYSRRLKQKNRMLYNQVQELVRNEKAAENCLFTRPEESLSKEMLLFRKISEYVRTYKPFTNNDINRKALADAVGTNEMYLAEAIKAGTGETFSEYIGNVRLQYAIDILNNDPKITFENLAIDAGYGSYSQFFRSFSKKYGINPSEYRKLAEE